VRGDLHQKCGHQPREQQRAAAAGSSHISSRAAGVPTRDVEMRRPRLGIHPNRGAGQRNVSSWGWALTNPTLTFPAFC
jgi:hypothetical protein